MKKYSISFVALVLTALVGCGDKTPPEVQSDCKADSVKEEVLGQFADKLKSEGAKGDTTASLRQMLAIKDVELVEKNTKSGYSKCTAKITVKYPDGLTDAIANEFSSEKSYEDFKDTLEEKYGIVNGAGIHAQLMDFVSDGPFGAVPVTPDPSTISRHQKIIRKNLEALMAEQADVAVSYEMTHTTDPDGKKMQKLKWQVNKRDALDINVVLISIKNLRQ